MSFEVLRQPRALRAAREIAFRDARARAVQYAKLAGASSAPLERSAAELHPPDTGLRRSRDRGQQGLDQHRPPRRVGQRQGGYELE
ncbi:SIMPL domain-containing protein [Streptosporangium longisporum]|uniref:SIMPL domain-containing protein n=1 Tax=Streptosporangium longisporum TaxID=46187 RepID=UPI003CD08F22